MSELTDKYSELSDSSRTITGGRERHDERGLVKSGEQMEGEFDVRPVAAHRELGGEMRALISSHSPAHCEWCATLRLFDDGSS